MLYDNVHVEWVTLSCLSDDRPFLSIPKFAICHLRSSTAHWPRRTEPSCSSFTGAALASGAFAGIRTAEVCRRDWSEVNLEKGLIEIKKGKAKTRSRRLVPTAPASS